MLFLHHEPIGKTNILKHIKIILSVVTLLLLSVPTARAQVVVDESTDATGAPIFSHSVRYAGEVEFQGEMIPWFVLSDVYCFNTLTFKSSRKAKKYYKMVNNIKKVYPIAVDIKKTIDKTIAHMDSLPDKRSKDEYMKKAEKELKKLYTPRLKKLTFSRDPATKHSNFQTDALFLGFLPCPGLDSPMLKFSTTLPLIV